MFKRILVPLDGSERAERALPVAARLARASGGSISLVRVLNTEMTPLPSTATKPIIVPPVGEADQVLAESYLKRIADSQLLSGISAQTYAPASPVAPGILAVAADTDADIIVMCSHGHTGVTHWWMLGSVSTKVARFAQTPVLVLREGGSVPPEHHPNNRPLSVLVPLDGSDYARAALVPAAYLAAGLAAPDRGALHLAHIVQPPHEVKIPGRAARTAARASHDTQTAHNMTGEYLHAMIQHIKAEPDIAHLNLEFTSSVTTADDVAQGIIKVADDGGDDKAHKSFGGSDAIAMTTQGYSGPQPWVGSVTERVLAISHLPLLCVRPRG